ncbi:hypothetical protein D3C74_112590 [compost metagenome]
MTYFNTFIQVALDCPVEYGVVPPIGPKGKSLHVIQYELLSAQPYQHTHEELLYQTHLRHKGIASAEAEFNEEQIRSALFSKKHPCLRASMLPKKYGWGIHYDADGKIAIYGKESPEYQHFTGRDGQKQAIQLLYAMRSQRTKS